MEITWSNARQPLFVARREKSATSFSASRSALSKTLSWSKKGGHGILLHLLQFGPFGRKRPFALYHFCAPPGGGFPRTVPEREKTPFQNPALPARPNHSNRVRFLRGSKIYRIPGHCGEGFGAFFETQGSPLGFKKKAESFPGVESLRITGVTFICCIVEYGKSTNTNHCHL